MEEYQGDVNPNMMYIPQNIPINNKKLYPDQIDFIQELLNKDEIKNKISKDLQLYFATIVKNLAIANFTEQDIKMMILRFDDFKTTYLMQYPPGAYTFQIEYEFTALRNLLCTELTRGRDGFERKMMSTNIQQSYVDSNFNQNIPHSNNGIMGKFRRFFSR